jgi:predicted metal-dependent hydrolase
VKRADTETNWGDRLPADVTIVRERRRTVELSMSGGKLVARVPRRIGRRELSQLLEELRGGMNADMARKQILDDGALAAAAELVRRRWLADLQLPPYGVCFAGRMRKRWASCSVDAGGQGSIRVSRLLRGHPRWLLEHLLLHELIHLRIANHGPRFQALLARSPYGPRADGYLEALEHREQWGRWLESAAIVSGAATATSPAAQMELGLDACAPDSEN